MFLLQYHASYQSSLERCQNGKMSCSRTISAITCFRKRKEFESTKSKKNSLYKAKSTYLQALSPIKRNVNQLMNYYTKIKNSMSSKFSKLRLECTKIQAIPNWKPKEIRKLYQYRKMLFAVTCCLHNFQSIAINKIVKNFSRIFFFLRHII